MLVRTVVISWLTNVAKRAGIVVIVGSEPNSRWTINHPVTGHRLLRIEKEVLNGKRKVVTPAFPHSYALRLLQRVRVMNSTDEPVRNSMRELMKYHIRIESRVSIHTRNEPH